MFTSALKSFTSNIAANYTLSNTPTSIAGAWKIFDGKNKATGKLVSVFVFDRKSLEPAGGLRSRSNGASRRKIHDEVVERLKKEASSLARLRHPNILLLAEPVEDTRNGGLMFATEPITATLATLLQDQDDQSSSGHSRGRSSRHRLEGEDGGQKELGIDELEIRKGLLQVAKGLEFLHESAGLVHGNLTPEAIYINQKSDWKISGLGFAGPSDNATSTATPPIALSEALYFNPRLPRAVQMNLDFTSPDFVMDSSISPSADMFSLGLVILALYNSPHESPLHTSFNISTYKKLFTSSSTTPSSSNNFLSSRPLPKELLPVLARLITRRQAQRMNAREFQQSGFFDNILVSTIRFLDSLPTKNPNEKSQFLRGLPRILERFPKSVLDKKVLPALLEETKDKELLSLILQSVFKIIKTLPSSQRALTDKVLPRLREVFLATGGKGASADRDAAKEAGLMVILENMRLIGRNCSGKEFKDDIFPIIQLGLESHTHSVVDKALGCLPTILALLDFSTIKHDLFPLIAAIFTKTSSLAVKIRGLEALSVLCGGLSGGGAHDGSDRAISKSNGPPKGSNIILDKYTIQEKVVPLLKAIKTKEPAVMMATLAVFKQVGEIADSEFLAMDVLPILWSFSLGPLLNLQQFSEHMDLIKSLSAKIEQERIKKLSELSSNSSNGFDTSRSNDLMSTGSMSDAYGAFNVSEDDFKRLVLGKGSGSGSDTIGGSTRLQPLPSQSIQTSSSGSPGFAWSSQGQGSSISDVLRPQQAPNSRAITPDQSLNSFAALKPSHVTSSIGNTTGSWSNMKPLRPLQPVKSSTVATNPWASPPQANGISNGWTSPPTPHNLVGNAVAKNGFSQPVAAQNTFSNPPPGSMADSAAKKTGLDKYESLL
ncbi:MAG: hypothetical protein Q9187_000720 [Circinaria calcarea]